MKIARPFLRVATERAPVTAVYGGGGIVGIAYGLGVARALQDSGVPLSAGDAIGTSAGAWVAACLATDVAVEDLLAQPAVRLPNPRPGWLYGVAREFFGATMDARVRAVAVQVPWWRRQVLSGDDLSLADLVAASSAVPGLFAPHLIAGRLYVDGGMRSMASADLAPAADHLLVITPLAGPHFGLGGRLLEHQTTEEARRWEVRTGGCAQVIQPNKVIAAHARSPRQLFDRERAREVYGLAYQQGLAALSSRPQLAQLVS